MENSNLLVNVSNEKRRQMLLEIYQSEAGILHAIKERLKELKFKREFMMRKASSNSLSSSKSPYSFPVWGRKRVGKKKVLEEVDELVATMEKKLNDELDLIWKNVSNSPTRKQKNPKNELQDSENFSSEYKDTVGKLGQVGLNDDKNENSNNYEASFLKSCATRSLNFLKQASLKINFGFSQSPSGKGTSPSFGGGFENSDLKSDDKISEAVYENLVVNLTRKKWGLKSDGNQVI